MYDYALHVNSHWKSFFLLFFIYLYICQNNDDSKVLTRAKPNKIMIFKSSKFDQAFSKEIMKECKYWEEFSNKNN